MYLLKCWFIQQILTELLLFDTFCGDSTGKKAEAPSAVFSLKEEIIQIILKRITHFAEMVKIHWGK